MSNDEKKPYKRVSSDEQAYDDLLSFYSSDTKPHRPSERSSTCLLYTSDAADEL